MSHDSRLQLQLEQLLRYGTTLCSVVIALGVLLDSIMQPGPPVDLVKIGILGFIALPVIRILRMLMHYASARDVAMVRVAGGVLTLVIVGAILGIIW